MSAYADYLEEQTGLDFYRYGDDTTGVLNWTDGMAPGKPTKRPRQPIHME